MTKKQLIETIRRVIKETLEEANAPAPSKAEPREKPGPDIAEPGTEEENEPDEYTLNPEKGTENIPDVAPKATRGDAKIVAQIVKKYRAAKKTNEAQYQFQSPELQVPGQMSLSQFEPKPLKPGEIEITKELIDQFIKEKGEKNPVKDFIEWIKIKANKNS